MGAYHPYLVWDRWPWAPFRTVTQSQDQFVASMVVQAMGAVLILVVVVIAMAVRFGPIAAGATLALVTVTMVAGNYARWKAGRRGALWHSRDNP